MIGVTYLFIYLYIECENDDNSDYDSDNDDNGNLKSEDCKLNLFWYILCILRM
jgi:hypothetical protein